MKLPESKVAHGMIHCINHNNNDTPYWSGGHCDHVKKHDNKIVTWVCAACITKVMPMPKIKVVQQPAQPDPVTGKKRGRGRPKGSLNKKTYLQK